LLILGAASVAILHSDLAFAKICQQPPPVTMCDTRITGFIQDLDEVGRDKCSGRDTSAAEARLAQTFESLANDCEDEVLDHSSEKLAKYTFTYLVDTRATLPDRMDAYRDAIRWGRGPSTTPRPLCRSTRACRAWPMTAPR
jgi:hypothetical protein